jgi:hypothetical protein
MLIKMTKTYTTTLEIRALSKTSAIRQATTSEKKGVKAELVSCKATDFHNVWEVTVKITEEDD